MKLVSGKKYDTKLSDWDMDRIEEVEMEYGKLSRVIVYRQEVLQGKRPDRSQGQPALSKTSPHMYRSNQFEKQEPQPFSHQYPGQSSSKQYPFVSQDARNQPYQPTHGPQYASENRHNHSDHQPETTPAATSFKKPLTAMDVGRYNMRNRRNDSQPETTPAATSFKKPLTAMNVDRYNIRNRRNDHQPAPAPVSNPVLYHLTS